jgi:L-galactose dehydrogenase/L-glyceraldehyde 3-phosphate reductase
MQYRTLGRTGAKLSLLGFGCGAVGGLMVRGAPADQEHAVGRALDAGINYFDTAAAYGNGASETNLGRVLKALKPEIFLSTKFTIGPQDRGDIAGAVQRSLEASLRRLGRDSVDLLQVHNRIAAGGEDRPLDAAVVLGEVAPALERMRKQGKIRFFGITALGDTPALHKVVESRAFDTAQIVYNLLNPSAAVAVRTKFPAQDFTGLMTRAHAAGMGTIGIRALAGGALSGSAARHPTGMASVAPIASGPDYRADVGRAHAFDPLVKGGHAASLAEAALRFIIGCDALTTMLIGTSTLEQLEAAISAVEKGPLPSAALDVVPAIWRGMTVAG